jgi:two-component SAPR family response regulator
MTEIVTNDQKQNKKVVGVKVDAQEYNILKQYGQIFSTINRFKNLIQCKTADYLKLAISVF